MWDQDCLVFEEEVAMGKGCHGFWGSAKTNGNGRNGGTPVLARRPVQISKGGDVERGTLEMECWARRRRLHNATEDPAQEAVTASRPR